MDYPFYTQKNEEYDPDDFDYKTKFPSYPNEYITSEENLIKLRPPPPAEEFSYDDNKNTGPSNWGRFSKVCKIGKRQSPINLIEDHAIQQPTQRSLIIEGFSNIPTSMKVENNGHSAKFSFVYSNNKPIRFLGGPLKTAYNLDSFHFHWGLDDLYVSIFYLKLICFFNIFHPLIVRAVNTLLISRDIQQKYIL